MKDKKLSGIIKKYFSDKGYGFISSEGKDIFFHISKVSDKDSIAEGKQVEFNLTRERDGRESAKNLKVIKSKNSHEIYKDILNDNNEWSIMKTRMPKDTKDTLYKCMIDNFSLKLNKAAQFDKNGKFIFFKTDKGKIILNVQPDYYKIPLNEILVRLKELEFVNYEIRKLKDIKVDWRLVVGLGGGSVYETSMTLHHIYGIPYIPGSAVKGVTRSWIIAEVFNNKEETALKDPNFIEIFGNQKQQGKVIFMDAFPGKPPTIEPDVMNPHYGDYYSKNEDRGEPIPPADYLNPVPIFFLTVKEASFSFYLLAKNKYASIFDNKIGDFTILEWLKKALIEHGIGAKTAVGYGYFKD